MSTIMGITSLQLNHEEKVNLVQTLDKHLGTIFLSARAITMQVVDPDFCTDLAKDQTTLFICVPPTISVEKKREAVELANNAMLEAVGYKGLFKVIVLFHYHTYDSVGKDGELLLDIMNS